jgi:hypothetical protein
MTDPAFLLSYVMLWLLAAVQSAVLVRLLRSRARPERLTADPAAAVRPGAVVSAFTVSRADSGEPAGLEDLRGSSFMMMIAAGGCHNCVEALPAVCETARPRYRTSQPLTRAVGSLPLAARPMGTAAGGSPTC